MWAAWATIYWLTAWYRCCFNCWYRCCRFAIEQERKWVIENQVDQQQLVVEIKDPKQSVYIYNCTGSVVQVGLLQL